MRIVSSVLALLALWLCLTVIAASPTPAAERACFSFDDVAKALVGEVDQVALVKKDKLPEFVSTIEQATGLTLHGPFPPVTRAFVFTDKDGVLSTGLEVGGCLFPKIKLHTPELSGRTHSGDRTGA